MYRIIGADQQEYGPVSGELIRQWLREGRLDASSKIQAEGSGEWRHLREVPEFAALLAPPPPPITYTAKPAPPLSNALANWALGTGIASLVLWCIPVIAPASIVLGTMALAQLRQNPNQTGRGFAIAGIVLGGVSLLFTVMAILFYLFNQASFR